MRLAINPEKSYPKITMQLVDGKESMMAQLIWGMLFGVVGMAYFAYGKKQQRGSALLAGIALMAFPYFVANAIFLVAIGILLIALPFFISW